MAHGEPLLGRRAEAEPENIRTQIVDGRDHLGFFPRTEVTVAMADDIEPRVEFVQMPDRAFDHRPCRAEKVERRPATLGDLGDLVDEVGRRHALRQLAVGKELRGEYQRHAVGVDQVG